VVRAPLTGIVLVIEMTASVAMLLPMLGACFVAMLVPVLLRNPPIYDPLREIALQREREGPTSAPLLKSEQREMLPPCEGEKPWTKR
jgi:H+/Cl- antiporter ClcA